LNKIMRKKIVAGNWKMNLNKNDSEDLVNNILNHLDDNFSPQIIFAPPYLFLNNVIELCKNKNNIFVSSQDCSAHTDGAFTGEVSAKMISSYNISHVIIGHSERRKNFNETNDILNHKINQAINNHLNVIFCCGETLSDRNNGLYFDVISDQLLSTVLSLDKSKFSNIIIAYEPIWAIGTGVTATADQAQEVHAHIRRIIKDKYGDAISNKTSIIYGGSCKPANAKEIFSQDDIDGGLIGGASLNYKDFISIIKAF